MGYVTNPSKRYNTGNHIWRHGTIKSWHQNNKPERWLLGPCPKCGAITSNYGSSYSCNDIHCPHNSSNFAISPGPMPNWWNTSIEVKLDGNAWCAYNDDDFIDIQESVAGFGDTPREAVLDYMKQITAIEPANDKGE